jgi:DNA-binding protein HU-beta
MNQQQLINEIAAHTANEGVSKAAVKFVLDGLSKVAHHELKKGGEVVLPGIGKLTVETRATGEAIDIPEKRVPKFSALTVLKEAVA